MVRVMSVVPSARAVTVPSSAMVATVLLLESHTAVWSVAFSGIDRVGQFLGLADEQGQFGLRKFDFLDTDRSCGDGECRFAVFAAADCHNYGFTFGYAGHDARRFIDRGGLRSAGYPFHGFVRGVLGQDLGFQGKGGSCDDAAGRRGDFDFGDGDVLVLGVVVVTRDGNHCECRQDGNSGKDFFHNRLEFRV